MGLAPPDAALLLGQGIPHFTALSVVLGGVEQEQ